MFQCFKFFIVAMVASVAYANSDASAQVTTLDAPDLTYTNVPTGSKPTGFFYSVQVNATSRL